MPLLCRFITSVKDLPDRESHDPKYFLSEKLKIISPNEHSAGSRVLILSRKIDFEADSVGMGLLKKGIDYVRLNSEDLLDQLRIRYLVKQASDTKVEFSLRNETVETTEISVAWLREFNIKRIIFGDTDLTHTFSYQQWDDACQILENHLKCQWINTPSVTAQAGDRVKQLVLAKKVGFHVPATLITNDPVAANDFFDVYDGNVVLKALHHHNVEIRGKMYSMYTHRISEEDVLRFDDLVYAPSILQERLEKRSELRVTVVGKRVFAVEIDSRSALEGPDDMHSFRLSELPKKPVELEDEIADRCVNLINSMGLRYGAIDFVIDKNDCLTFLEVNSTGDWCWIEHQTGLAITEAMVDLIEVFARQAA